MALYVFLLCQVQMSVHVGQQHTSLFDVCCGFLAGGGVEMCFPLLEDPETYSSFSSAVLAGHVFWGLSAKHSQFLVLPCQAL